MDFIQSKITMAALIRSRYFVLFSLLSICIVVWLWSRLLVNESELLSTSNLTNESQASIYNTPVNIPAFSNKAKFSYETIQTKCYKGREPKSIEDLQQLITLLSRNKLRVCQEQHKLFKRIFQIREKQTTIVISDTFMTKVQQWLKNDKELIEATKKQLLIFVDNLWSFESVIFNPVRARRPGGNGENSVEKYVKDLVEKSRDGCDFCAYKKYTASDEFGTLESLNSVIVSNTFKIEKYHGMVLLKKHDPIHFSQEEYIDAIDLSMSWFETTHNISPNHKYRIMYWDYLPKASTSQIHPHLHLTLGDYAYYAKWNQLYKAGLEFSKETHKNYWTSLLEIHNTLGLTVQFGSASVMAYITPQKDFEVFIISQKPCLDFFRLVFFTIRTFMDDLGQYSISSGYVFPKIGTNYKNGEELPMLMRIVSRGSADSTRGDISSFDLFGTPNVNKDPYKVIHSLRSSIDKWKDVKFSYKPKNLS